MRLSRPAFHLHFLKPNAAPAFCGLAALSFIAALPMAAAQTDRQDAQALIGAAMELADEGKSIEALEKADDAFFAVWERLPLAFRKVELASARPEGYDRFDARESNTFDPGQEIYVYVDPIGFGWRKDGDDWETELTSDFLLATPEGRIIAGQKNFGEFQIRAPQRGRESFLVFDYRFTGVPAGDYILTTTVHDRIDDETASFDLPITIR